MTCNYLSPSSRNIKGFSLIELMVSITIGLVIMVASLSAYTGASGATRMAEAQGLMSEDAQAALMILTQQLRMAGNNPDQLNRTNNSIKNPIYSPLGPINSIIRGCDGEFSNISDTNFDNLICTAGSTDSIAINYEADEFNTIPSSVGLPTDCVGITLTPIAASVATVTATSPATTASSPVSYRVAGNRFYISTENSRPSLYCKGHGDSSALVDNIEDMQFTYGVMKATTVDASATTAAVAGYLSADEVITSSTLADLTDDAARWAKVITVRICVLVRSEHPVVTDAASASYIACDGEVDSSQTDLRLRRAFSTTVVLRNRRI